MSEYTSVELLMDALDLRSADPTMRRHLGEVITRTSGRMDRVLGFSFGGDAIPSVLDGPGDSRLILPAPGALDVAAVEENGVTLSVLDYEVEPGMGRYILRLDANNRETWWTANPRSIVVTYTPNVAPDDLEQLCLVECVRAEKGKAAGFADVIGVEGSNDTKYTRAFAAGTMDALRQMAADYGIRNLIAV